MFVTAPSLFNAMQWSVHLLLPSLKLPATATLCWELFAHQHAASVLVACFQVHLEVAADSHAERGGNGGGAVARAEGVVLALGPVCEPCKKRGRLGEGLGMKSIVGRRSGGAGC